MRSALHDELTHARGQIASALSSGDQVLTLLVTVLIATVVALSTRYSPAVAVIAPFALAIPETYAIRLNAVVQSHGGYRRALEEQLNAGLPREAYLWESSVAPLLRQRTERLLSAAFGALWLAFVANATVSLVRADWSLLWLVPLGAGYLGLVLLPVQALKKGEQLFDATYRACNRRLTP